ncbi:MAG: WD40 repeat domain-containing protein, partial [Planctomycetota bacterium]|nr:WD40 repeat domain-containing protein [Planctomycetota bacterium]
MLTCKQTMQFYLIALLLVSLIFPLGCSVPVVRQGNCIKETDSVHSIAFTPDGNKIAIGCCDGWIHIRDVQSGKEVARFKHDLYSCERLKFSDDGFLLASESWNGFFCGNVQIDVWRMKDGKQLLPRSDLFLVATVSELSPNGQTIAFFTSLGRGGVYLYDIANKKTINLPELPLWDVEAIAFSGDGRRIAFASPDYCNRITIWNLPSFTKAASFGDVWKGLPTLGCDEIWNLAFLPDNALLAV